MPLLIAAPLLLAGCGGVEVAVPAQADTEACAAASGHWPDELAGSGTTQTDPSDPSVRAWGDPAIIARCGMPALGPTELQCVVVDEIDWVAEELSDGTKMTTFGRDPAIEVIVPKDHGPAPLLLPAFTEAVQELPRNDLTCT